MWCSLYLCGRGPRARVKDLDLGSKLMVGFLESNGQALLAQQIVAAHKLQHGDDKDELQEMDVDSGEELDW